MINTLGLNFNKNNLYELKQRLLFLFFSIIIFRFGSFVPIPGINTTLLSNIFLQQNNTIFNTLNIFSGGALNRVSIFALGVIPYISASIVIQLSSLIFPFLKEIKKDGESGRIKLNEYIRYMTVLFSFFQAITISYSLSNIFGINNLFINNNYYFHFISIISLVTGTVFLLWLAELITEKGIGNGISIFIFLGVLTNIPINIINIFIRINSGEISYYLFFFILCFLFLIIYVVVYIECSQRKISIIYARNQYTRRFYSAQNSHLPLKINISGVIPAIFTSSIFILPVTIFSWFHLNIWLNNYYILNIIYNYFTSSHFFYIIIYSFFIIFFCYFYSLLIFNPKETSYNLKKSGAFIPGIRPGINTENYIKKILLRITFIGSLYITCICLFPELIKIFINIPFTFCGTSLLIVVVVIIEFISQIQTLLLSSQYKNALKKSNLYFNKKQY